ncbi:hypothetical protein [Paenibacillus xylanilyticus]|uniref:Uncharacterized protein n=1 Tax=Paenibacillus xylanilyticus TaxID=248903 RepID=A0A7Y6EYL3_9BACL|nr:hypothetical protein [Paenibacillus xylanilyticus]NUU80066.1 hypothetical protein [Paenibacillus xylanilyticus]
MFVVKDILDDGKLLAYFESRKNAEKYHCIEFKNFDGIDISQVNQIVEVTTLDKVYEDIPYHFYIVEAEGEIEYFDDEVESKRVLNNHIAENMNDYEGYVAEHEEYCPSDGEKYYEAFLWWRSETRDGKKYTKKYSD